MRIMLTFCSSAYRILAECATYLVSLSWAWCNLGGCAHYPTTVMSQRGLPRTGEADSSTKLNSPRIFYASLGVLKMSWWKTFLENTLVNFMIKGKSTHVIWAICKQFHSLVATKRSVVPACSGLIFVFTGGSRFETSQLSEADWICCISYLC